MPFSNPVVAGNTLVRQAIQSANYSAGVLGWRIGRDGTAEFSQVTVRGTFTAGSSPGQIVQATVNGFFVFYDDGTSLPGLIQLTTASSGQYVELRMRPKPTAFQAAIDNVGGLQSIIGNNAGEECGYLLLYTPGYNGGARTAYIELFSESDNLLAAPKMNLSADVINALGALTVSGSATVAGNVYAGPNAGDLGRGIVAAVHDQGSSAAIGNTETVVLTSPTTTFKAGRVYRMEIEGTLQASVANNSIVARMRKTNAGGTQLAVTRYYMPTGSTYNGNVSFHFKVVGSDVTCELVFTIIGGAAFTATQTGSSSGARGMTIYDVGNTGAPGITNVVTLS